MNRVAALYDIHGNLPALEAVLEEVLREGADAIVVGGDMLPGPMPIECLHLVQSVALPVHFLTGNGDREVMELVAGGSGERIPPPFVESMKWNAAQLSTSDAAFIASWPPTVELQIAGLGIVLFCHATPRSDTEIMTQETPEAAIASVLREAGAPVLVCGHTHMAYDRVVGGVRVVNAGSIGMPFGPPGAHWAMLGGGVKLVNTRYNLTRAAERIRATEYPGAAAFAEGNVLSPPSEAEMLVAFTKSQLGR